MIAYVTIGTTDMERAMKFYTALLAELDPGIKVVMDGGRIKLWGKPGAPSLAVATPFDGRAATVGNGSWSPLPPTARRKSTPCTKRRWNWVARMRERQGDAGERKDRTLATSATWTAISSMPFV